MKAVSIRQPDAHRIAHGLQFAANRGHAIDHRGWLAIHAGKAKRDLAWDDHDRYPGMEFGAFVAVVYLAAVIRPYQVADLLRERPVECGWLKHADYLRGSYCWLFSHVYPLARPVAAKGSTGVFRTNVDLMGMIRDQESRTPHRADKSTANGEVRVIG